MRSLCLAVLLFSPALLHTATAAVLPAAVADAFDSYTQLPGILVPQLQKVQDTPSADAAAEPLKNTLTQVYEVREKLHKMPRLTPSQNQQVRLQYENKMRKEWARMYAEISRLQNARCYQSARFAEVFRLMCMMIEK